MRNPIKKICLSGILSAVMFGGIHAQECVDGFSDGNLCSNINQYAFMTAAELGGGIINDSWGWVSPETGKEYALQGRSAGTSFIDISEPNNPVYLGDLPTHDFEILWRDVKVYDNHAFIVAESGGHGMQVFDLTQLDDVVDPPVTFEETAHMPNFGNAHNIAINEETGYAYVVGSGMAAGGLFMIDIQDPVNPVPAGLFAEDGYTHDVQVVVYNGPDSGYSGRELAFASNENSMTIVDVTDKADPQLVSRAEYDSSAYAHQGWLTEDHRYFLLNDELDEGTYFNNTRTYIFDVQSLENPEFIGFYESAISSPDHNLYVMGNHCYQANYSGGLRVLRLNDLANLDIEEVAYYDIIPENNNIQFIGAWNIYPYFPSGTMILSNMYSGFHVLQPDFDTSTSVAETPADNVLQVFPNPSTGNVRVEGWPKNAKLLELFDLTGKRVAQRDLNLQDVQVEFDLSENASGIYLLKAGSSTSRLVIQ